ncbi:MAG: malonate decarboxylase subunit alpha, partial [Burkholderiales bacterium]|nr:malonate decarboxylase subunit alpha [Burkholderiales bacterium]
MEFDLERKDKLARLASVAPLLAGKWVDKTEIVKLLQLLIHSGDRVCLEGNNQKQAQFLARSLAQVDPSVVNNLHIVQSALSLPEHIS